MPPVSVPLTLPEGATMKASLDAFWPVRFSKPAKVVPSTVPALGPVTFQVVWSRVASGPVSVSAALLPTTRVMRVKPPVSPGAVASCRLTLTAEPRCE